MSDLSYAEQLNSAVDGLFSQGPHEKFEKYWKLYKESAYINEPKGIYFRISQDETYRNIVVAGDNRIVDVEVDESSGVEGVSVRPYRVFSGVGLYMGSIPTLPRTNDSLLTVVCVLGGSTSIGAHWSAHNQEEVERLRSFSRILVKAISF